MIRLGVLGWPVAHSLSPALQNAALAASGLGERWRYQLLPVPPERFAETARALPASRFRGANVTIPHKHEALALATRATDRAREIGAANTLLFEADGSIEADNTDAPALIGALDRIGTRAPGQSGPVAGRDAVVLGAGGSARAAVWALREAGASSVRVWNRNPERARELADELGADPIESGQDVRDPGVLVNCTAVGLRIGDDLSGLPALAQPGALSRYGAVVDFVYADGGTPLLRAAHAAGVATIDGLELLVGQGALSFELFTGHRAPVDVMRAAVGLSSAR